MNNFDGWINVYKPKVITSFDVIRVLIELDAAVNEPLIVAAFVNSFISATLAVIAAILAVASVISVSSVLISVFSLLILAVSAAILAVARVIFDSFVVTRELNEDEALESEPDNINVPSVVFILPVTTKLPVTCKSNAFIISLYLL